jgi:hypothetical protein
MEKNTNKRENQKRNINILSSPFILKEKTFETKKDTKFILDFLKENNTVINFPFKKNLDIKIGINNVTKILETNEDTKLIGIVLISKENNEDKPNLTEHISQICSFKNINFRYLDCSSSELGQVLLKKSAICILILVFLKIFKQ